MSNRINVTSKMSDSKSIVRFVKDIERHPCLYNPKSFQYVDRELKRRTWIDIARRLNTSVVECKEKWRKIRTAYGRSLKPKFINGVRVPSRPYYLASYLKFITPTARKTLTRKLLAPPSKNMNIPSNTIVKEIKVEEPKFHERSDDSIEELDGQDENPNDPSEEMFLVEYNSTDEDDNVAITDKGPIKETISNEENQSKNNIFIYNEVNKPNDKEIKIGNNLNSDNIRERCNYCVNIERRPRKMFLFSLLPDIEALADHQMRSFRRGLIDLLDKCKNLDE